MAKNSRDYWKQREEENLKHYLLEEEDYTKRLHEILDYTADQIQRQIDGFYSKYAKKEGITLAEAKRRVKQVDIDEYSRKAKKYVAEKNFSKQANDEMRLYNATMKINRLELLKANIGLELTAGFDDLQKQLEEDLTSRATEELKRQAGILGETVLNNEKTAKAIVNASFRNATYSERIWMYQGMMKSELDKLLRQGLIQGQNPRQLAAHLQKLFGASKYNAERLMRTELARVQIEAQKQSFEQNGYEEYIFLALGTACEVCRELDEKHFKVKDMVPGENAPPMHPNCRCSTAAYMNEVQGSVENLAKVVDSMYIISETEKETFTKQQIADEMETSPIGRKVIKWIENSNVKIAIYEDEYADGQRGDQRGDSIRIFPQNIPSLRVYVQTVIHEMGHYHYDIGNCQHAEAICFGLEKLHITGNEKLTSEEWNYVKKLAIDNYTNLEWEAGGYGDYSKIRLYD